jgi:large subunit ribosomal protein L21
MYAIIETGGKQYRVTPGDVVSIESLTGDVGQSVTFDKVLLIGGKADSQILVGAPYIAAAALTAEIVEHTRGEKILTIKYKRRKGYRRMIGHRQEITRILVTKIEDGKGQTLSLEKAQRTETLTKASVPFSKRQAEHQAKHLAAKPAVKTKKASAKAEASEAAPKKTAAKKTSTKAKKE